MNKSIGRVFTLMFGLITAVALSGCDDAAKKLQQRGADVARAARTTMQEVEWGPLFAEFESAGLNIRELAGLFTSNRWDDAKAWIAKIDSASTRTVFSTIGEVLYLEEMEGVEPCKSKIDEWLKNQDISPERKKTLEIMRAYVGGKSGKKTADIAILIGLVYLSHNGFDYAVKFPHGNKVELDQLLFLAAVTHARATLHQKTNDPPAAR